MSIASEITSIENNISNNYKGISNLGVDLTNIDKNIENIATCLDSVYSNYPKVSNTGTEVSLNPTNKGKLQITEKGNSTQDGTPTPTNPISIKSVTGNNNVVVHNKNLFELQDLKMLINSSGSVITNNSAQDVIIDVSSIDYITVSGDFTLLGDGSIRAGLFQEYPAIGDTTTRLSITQTTTIDVRSGKYLLLCVLRATSSTTWEQISNSFQAEVGQTATSYIAPTSQTLPLNLGSIELNKIGTYQDYIYKNNGNWYKKEYIGTLNVQDFKDSPSWQIANSGTASWYYSLINTGYIPIANAFSTDYGLCNHYQLTAVGNSGANEGISLLISGTIRIRYGTQDTTSNFKTWLASNEVILKYAKSTSTDIEITDTTLISQLEAIDNMYSYNGTTIITSTYDSSNAQMELQVSSLRGN